MTTLVISTDAPAVAGPPQGHWTYADWAQLPDDDKRQMSFDCLPTIRVPVGELFAGAPDTTLQHSVAVDQRSVSARLLTPHGRASPARRRVAA